MLGELSVLNVGAGDIRVIFNQEDRGETKKAIRMLTDMQQRGYAIMVELPDRTYARAQTIDGSSGCYVIVVPEDVELPDDASVESVTKPQRGRKSKKAKLPIKTSKAVGVARSAGG